MTGAPSISPPSSEGTPAAGGASSGLAGGGALLSAGAESVEIISLPPPMPPIPLLPAIQRITSMNTSIRMTKGRMYSTRKSMMGLTWG